MINVHRLQGAIAALMLTKNPKPPKSRLKMSDYISRTGRVQSWIDEPDGRLPVSCTVFKVDNELEGPNGIEASGDLRVTLYETAQELLSTYQNWIHEDTRERQASLRVVLYHLDESTRLLTKLSAEAGSTKMAQ